MYIQGNIKSYNAERGFGFIEVSGENISDVFFHISDLPQRSTPPQLGEMLKFILVEDAGQFKASSITRLDIAVPQSAPEQVIQAAVHKVDPSPRYTKRTKKMPIFPILGIIVIAVLAFLTYEKYQEFAQARELKAQQVLAEQQQIIAQQRQALGNLPDQALSEQGARNLDAQVYQTAQPRAEHIEASIEKKKAETFIQPSDDFKCDGRQHCSQMRSYEEAVYFLRNCPNVQMDGNDDGVPCERQFNR